MRRAPRLIVAASMATMALPLTATLVVGSTGIARADEVSHAAGFTLNQTWTQTLNDANNPIVDSSPNVADLDGQPSVVVGDRAGYVYAFHLSGGRPPPRLAVQRRRGGRLVSFGGADQRRRLDTVYVGDGQRRRIPPPVATRPSARAAATSGSSRRPTRRRTDTAHSAVTASLTVGNYAGGYGVEAGSLGQNT